MWPASESNESFARCILIMLTMFRHAGVFALLYGSLVLQSYLHFAAVSLVVQHDLVGHMSTDKSFPERGEKLMRHKTNAILDARLFFFFFLSNCSWWLAKMRNMWTMYACVTKYTVESFA